LKDRRQQEFKDRINLLAKEIHDKKPLTDKDYVERAILTANINVLKEFADRNFEGEKPEWFVSSAYNNSHSHSGDIEDRFYIPYNEQKKPSIHVGYFEKLRYNT
jgi:hypothetical protein